MWIVNVYRPKTFYDLGLLVYCAHETHLIVACELDFDDLHLQHTAVRSTFVAGGYSAVWLYYGKVLSASPFAFVFKTSVFCSGISIRLFVRCDNWPNKNGRYCVTL